MMLVSFPDNLLLFEKRALSWIFKYEIGKCRQMGRQKVLELVSVVFHPFAAYA